ncbi:MAG: homoserine dehydrogenase [Oscillospiraceae bacterium]|nr:homoserine dehydrogenase [Oscillospiraceae bacterium]
MNIALLGFGVVCGGVYDILKNMPEYNVKKILIRNPAKLTMDCMTLDFADIENDSEIDLVVEAIGGLHPAREYILAALNAKKHVVTANKAVVAAYFDEFVAAAKENGVKFMVEATSGGGIPWIKNLQRVGRIDKVTKLHGIMNGTSNFILSAMTCEGKDFSDVLKTAQELGYAEADPSADIDGDDVRNKCAISAAIAFDTKVDVNSIMQAGIRHITKADIDWFKENGLVCKLFATAVCDKDNFDAVVEPVLLGCDTVEANVPKNYNITCLYGETIGEVKLYGQGAGGLPTGNAIVQDIIDINTNNAFDISFGKEMNKAEIIRGKYYIRIPAGLENYTEFIGDITEKTFTLGDDTVVVTTETTPAKIHSLLDANKDKAVFVARYF